MPFFTNGQTTRQIVDSYIAASGGLEKWKTVNSCARSVKILQNLDYINLPNNLKSSIDTISPSQHQIIKRLPNFEVDRMVATDGTVTTLYQNDRKSGISTGGLFFDNPLPNKYVTVALQINLMQLDNEGLLTYIGESTRLEKPCFVIEGPYDLESTEKVKFHFSKETGQLEAIENSNPGKLRLTKFSDYKNIKGLIVPFKIETYADDILFYREIIETIEFNPRLDKSVFYYKPEKDNRDTEDTAGITVNRSFDGDLKDLIKSNYSNKRIFIDMWATWCAPCKIEFKKYDSAFYRTLSELDASLVFISIDKSSAAKAWEKDIYKYQLKGAHFLAGKKLLQSLQQEVFKNGTVSIPRYLVVSESGAILSSDFIRPSDHSFGYELEKLLRK
jgi:thiol-disulfide isomerase/thioredoxin